MTGLSQSKISLVEERVETLIYITSSFCPYKETFEESEGCRNDYNSENHCIKCIKGWLRGREKPLK